MTHTVDKTVTKTAFKTVALTLSAALMSVTALGTTAHAGDYYVQTSAPYMSATSTAQTFGQNRMNTLITPTQSVGNPYTVHGQTYYPAHDPSYNKIGAVSWYGDRFHGKLTASGETYNKAAMTAAHKTLPLNSLVTVTNTATGHSLTVRINDRGPFVGNGIIDLSEAAANALGFTATGGGNAQVTYAGSAQQTYAPQFQAPRYQPQFKAQVMAPVQPQYRAQVQAPAQAMTFMPNVQAPRAQVSIPQAAAQNGAGQTTLTIKGPIHMATHKSTDGQARLIKAVNRVTYTTK